jgi:hypothetical protein
VPEHCHRELTGVGSTIILEVLGGLALSDVANISVLILVNRLANRNKFLVNNAFIMCKDHKCAVYV